MSLCDETFDVVVVGTSTMHSMLAGALSLAGKRVLHLDRREYYGGIDASLTMEQLVEFSKKSEKEEEEVDDKVLDVKIDEDIIKCDEVDELVVLSASCDGQKALDFIVERNKRVSREAACAANMASQAASLYESQAKDQIEVAVSVRSKLEEEKEKDKEEENDDKSENKEEENDDKSENKEEENNTNDKSENKEEDEDKSENKGEIETKTPVENLVRLLDKSRRFNLDLTPRLILARGQLVDAMVRTNVHRYMEFTTLHHTTVGFRTPPSITVQHVPSNKRDVFMCNWLTLREKRSLMHFLRFCMDYAFEMKNSNTGVDVTRQNETMLQQQRSLARPQNKKSATKSYDLDKYSSFEEMLEASNMSSKLRSIATYGLGFANSSLEPLETRLAMKRVCAYVSSLGKHGLTAFLISIYGSGEVPQSFCRLAAVNRAIYKLREPVRGVAVDKTKHCRGVIIQEGCIRCDRVVMEASTLPSSFRVQGDVTIVRTTAVLSGKVFQGTDDESKIRTLSVVVPGEGNDSAVRCYQVSAGVRRIVR